MDAKKAQDTTEIRKKRINQLAKKLAEAKSRLRNLEASSGPER